MNFHKKKGYSNFQNTKPPDDILCCVESTVHAVKSNRVQILGKIRLQYFLNAKKQKLLDTGTKFKIKYLS